MISYFISTYSQHIAEPVLAAAPWYSAVAPLSFSLFVGLSLAPVLPTRPYQDFRVTLIALTRLH